MEGREIVNAYVRNTQQLNNFKFSTYFEILKKKCPEIPISGL